MEEYIGKICPYCNTEIKDDDAIKVCPSCGIPHHEECWEENHGCTNLECNQNSSVLKPDGDTDEVELTNEVEVTDEDTNEVEVTDEDTNEVEVIDEDTNEVKKEEENEPLLNDATDLEEKSVTKKKPSRKLLLGTAAVLIVLVIAILIPSVILPQINLNKAKEAFDASNYVEAIELYEKSGYQENPDNIQQYSYAVATTKFEEKSYLEAATNYHKAEGILDSDEKIFECGSILLENELYDDAASCFILLSTDEAKANYDYCLGMSFFNEKNYTAAIANLGAAKNHVEIANQKLSEVYCEYGKQYFNEKNYDEAKKQLKKAGDNSEAKTYLTACDLMEAEQYLSNGEINKAKEIYTKLPKDFSFNGIEVSKRKNQFKKFNAFCNISGKWTVTSNYIEARDVYRRNGSGDGWVYDEPVSGQSLEVKCYLNNDDTITIKGNVTFRRFTKYSSLSKYCEDGNTTKSFTIKNVKSIPSSIKIDSNTTLKYANGKFNLSYSLKDDYSNNFYYLYKSSVTYGKRTVKY